MRQYRVLWTVPGAPTLLIGGVIARIGHGITVVAWLLLIRAVTGSYADAALVGAAISLATAFGAPIAGRLTDRYGASKVLPLYAIGYGFTQLALLTAILTTPSLGLLAVLAAITGVLFPPMSPALRSAWTTMTSEDSGRSDARTAAMAAESTLLELVFVLGPLVLSGFLLAASRFDDALNWDPSVAGPSAALITASLTTVLGTVWVSRGRAVRSLAASDVDSRTVGIGPLRTRGFPVLLLVTAGVAFSFGASPVAIAAFAENARGADGAAVTGVLIAVWSLGSAAGGIAYGAARSTMRMEYRLVVALAVLTLGYAAWVLVESPVVMGVLLVFSGAVIAPAMTIQAELVGAMVPTTMLTEAFTWLTAVNMSLAALGAAVAGVLVDGTWGATGGFWACAAATAVASGIAVILAATSSARERATVEVA